MKKTEKSGDSKHLSTLRKAPFKIKEIALIKKEKKIMQKTISEIGNMFKKLDECYEKETKQLDAIIEKCKAAKKSYLLFEKNSSNS